MKRTLLLLLLAAAVLPAFAAKKVVGDITAQAAIPGYYRPGSDSVTPLNTGVLSDGDLETGIALNVAGAYLVADFSGAATTAEPMFYVDEITIGHAASRTYSLYVSTDYKADTNTGTWTPVAERVTTTGETVYPVKDRILAVKYVIEAGSLQQTLCEFRLTGYRSSVPDVVSRYEIASFHNASGGLETGEFGGGNNSFWGTRTPGQQLFNGKFEDYQMWPKAPDGGYVMVDFTSTNGPSHLPEYYITEILVGSTGQKKFTLQYSEDGTTWNNVEGAVGVSYNGTGKYAVGKLAKMVRYIWDQGSMWDFSTEYLAEVEVWGMNPDDVPCTHPSYTEWEQTIAATCTERAMFTRTCTICGQEFAKYSDELPLGHDYVTTLARPGLFSRHKDFPDNRRYGTGSITCSRCNFRLDFPKALDLVTNQVGGTVISGEKTEGVVRFTDLSVSSENHPEWGPGAKKIIDRVWGTTYDGGGFFEWPYWTTVSTNAQYADFEFGTTIDLTAIEFSVYNHDYLLEFYSINDFSGEETKFGEYSVLRDDTVVGTKTETVKVVDPETGEESEIQVEKEVTADYQRISVPFFETPIKHLRIYISDYEPIDLWGARGVRVLEIHPWGTVRGASDFEASKATFIIFK